MTRLLLLLISCAGLSATIYGQAAPKVERDIPYAEPKNERQLLDMYAPPSASNAPVVVAVHGGVWMRGSKNEVHHNPSAFVEKGFVFVPVNYRFIPNVPMETIVRDVAKATGWVYANIARYGGD